MTTLAALRCRLFHRKRWRIHARTDWLTFWERWIYCERCERIHRVREEYVLLKKETALVVEKEALV